MQEIGNKDDVRPVKKGQFSMFLSDKWYRCTMRPESVPEDPGRRTGCIGITECTFGTGTWNR